MFGFHIAAARFVSLGLFAGSTWLIYLTARRVGSSLAGSFAVLVFCLAPEVVSAAIYFSTEGTLFVAISAMLYFLSAYWSAGEEHSINWAGLGLAIGLGLLSKASFVLIAFPILAYTLIASYRRLGALNLVPWVKAGVLAFLVAGPWWLINIRPAVGYAKFALDQPRNSLGGGSHSFERWLSTIAQGLLGHGLSILIILVVALGFYKIVVRREVVFDPAQRTALIACTCGVVPIVLIQLAGTNDLLRYLTPAMIPLAILVGVLADKTGWTRRWPLAGASALCFGIQLLMLVAPVVFPNTQVIDPGFANGGLPWRVMVRFDQWDWKPLQHIGQNCGITAPVISYLGNGRAFNPRQIEYPWILGGTTLPEPQWLWRYESGPLEWQKVMGFVSQSDMVVTAPHYVGQVSDKQDLDNQHNAEFAERLAQDPRFQGPIRLEMGRFEPVEVLVFLRKNLVCRGRS
ncbi:MAG TPA: glycosyltransferase family 39 protein [Candidatus Acidoferrum sp.]|nr:glycosyltransferase family 39 protein [Candidatus Acidoferrum sp.]